MKIIFRSNVQPEAKPTMYAKSSTDVDETEKNPLNGIIMEAIGKEGVYKGKAGYTNYFQHMDKSMAIKGLDIKYLFIYCLFVCLPVLIYLLFCIHAN